GSGGPTGPSGRRRLVGEGRPPPAATTLSCTGTRSSLTPGVRRRRGRGRQHPRGGKTERRRYGATGGMVDALRRRSGRIPALVGLIFTRPGGTESDGATGARATSEIGSACGVRIAGTVDAMRFSYAEALCDPTHY